MIRQVYTGSVDKISKSNDYIWDLSIKIDMPIFFKAGQFISLFIDDKEARPLSIASSPRLSLDENKIRLIIGPKPEGNLFNFISNLKPNDPIRFRGPFGIFTLENTIFNTNNPADQQNSITESTNAIENKDIVFIATSTGIAPLLGMTEYLADIQYKGKVIIYFGLRFSRDIFLIEDFKKLKDRLNFEYFFNISKPEINELEEGNIKHGYVTHEVLNNQKIEDYCFICGSTTTVSAITDILKQHQFKNIFLENYG